jgi:thiamine kinase-like enzyme
MNHTPPATMNEPIPPPEELLNARPGEWITLDESHPTISYLNQKITGRAGTWEGARFSKAVYLYREAGTSESLMIKYYQPKTGADAVRHAEGELKKIERVQLLGMAVGPLRVIKPIAVWQGVLFLEYVPGLTLADIIAVRRSQPGLMHASLIKVAEFLVKLHSTETNIEGEIHQFNSAHSIKVARKYVTQLEKYGVLKDEPDVAEAVKKQITNWERKPIWSQYKPTLCHGDATTTNFVFPSQEEVVAIDWERLIIADPAMDVGRLLAELNHSLQNQGAQGPEIKSLIDITEAAYTEACPVNEASDGYLERTRFHQAYSTLRIARNGWIPRSERMQLVTQAMAWLA